MARESNAKFFAQSASSFVEMFAGLGAARIRRLFRQARKAAPAIVFIDELDAVGATRGNDIAGEKDQTLNQLLVELDGFGEADNVVVIAVQPAREARPGSASPGRFDRQILVTPPDLKGAAASSRCTPRQAAGGRRGHGGRGAPDERHDRRGPGEHLQRGGDLRRARPPRTAGDQGLPGALERVVAGMQSRRVITEHEKQVVAYHEAGHALCSELLESVEKVRISIIPRGKALGYTLNLPEEDRYLKTKEELLDYMVVLLGGRVTEHLIFGEITTGRPTTCGRSTRSAARW